MPDLKSYQRNIWVQRFRIKWLLALAILMILGSCTPVPADATSAISASSATPELVNPTPGITGTPTATPVPKGSEGNPVTLGIIYSDAGKQAPAAADFVQYLADNTGYIFALQTYKSEYDLLTAMDKGEVSLAWLQPEEYLYASSVNIASIAFLTSHYGLYGYGSYVFVKSDSKFRQFYNPDTGNSSVNASTALRQFSQKAPCLVNSRSISGYAYPLGLLAELNIITKEPVVMQTHEAVIRAVYTGGICDFGFTYGITGDPRTSSSIQADLPDVMDKVLIAWQSPADIPSLNLSYATLLSGDIRFKISSALEQFVKDPNGLQTLSQMTNYAIDEIRPASDDEYENLRAALQAAEINVQDLLTK